MTLPASPPISLAQVRAEFGAPAGTPLHAFVRGGAWVPNIAANANVPTAAPITLHQLCGAKASGYVPMSIDGPSSVSGEGTQTVGPSQPVAATTATAVCTINGGQGPFTSLWQYVSGTTATVNSPSSASTNFTRTAAGTLIGNMVSGVYRLKVTDATSAVAYGPNCTVTTTHYYDNGA